MFFRTLLLLSLLSLTFTFSSNKTLKALQAGNIVVISGHFVFQQANEQQSHLFMWQFETAFGNTPQLAMGTSSPMKELTGSKWMEDLFRIISIYPSRWSPTPESSLNGTGKYKGGFTSASTTLLQPDPMLFLAQVKSVYLFLFRFVRKKWNSSCHQFQQPHSSSIKLHRQDVSHRLLHWRSNIWLQNSGKRVHSKSFVCNCFDRLKNKLKYQAD